MTGHIFKRYDQELDKLVTRIIKMGDLAREQLEAAVKALKENSADLARLVIERDSKIDALDVKIDKLGMRLFALRQPMAMDLRLVMAAMNINRNIERIGDGIVNIAEAVVAGQTPPDLIRRTHIAEMCELVSNMFADALDSFIQNDIDKARKVAGSDEAVDRLDRENFRLLTGIMQANPDLIPAGCRLLDVNRNIERLADEATNIAEEVVFLVDAEIVKHRAWWLGDDETGSGAQ